VVLFGVDQQWGIASFSLRDLAVSATLKAAEVFRDA
jgi:hypothetical protein